MSLFGFLSIGDDGQTLVDSDHINLAVLQRGQFSTWLPESQTYPDNRHGIRVQVRYLVPVTDQFAPMVAFIPRAAVNGHWHSFQHTGGAGNWTGFDVSYMEKYPGEVVSNPGDWFPPNGLSYWDWAVASSEGNRYSQEMFGLRVWDENGKLAFDSGTPVMKLLGAITSWSEIGNYPQWRSYVSSWPYTANAEFGFIASNLPMQFINTSYAPYVSVRFGFTAARWGTQQIMCTVGGADRPSEVGLYNMIDSNVMDDDTLPNWIWANPIQLLVVRVR